MTLPAAAVVPPMVLFEIDPLSKRIPDGIGDPSRARRVRADLVPLHQGTGGPGVCDQDAVPAVARDHVAGARRGAADHGVVLTVGPDVKIAMPWLALPRSTVPVTSVPM